MSSSLLGHVPLGAVLESLQVTDARYVSLEAGDRANGTPSYYLARSDSRTTYVDKALAIRLRADGAVWRGEFAHDPCAVA